MLTSRTAALPIVHGSVGVSPKNSGLTRRPTTDTPAAPATAPNMTTPTIWRSTIHTTSIRRAPMRLVRVGAGRASPWVYEHVRNRGLPDRDRLPHIRIGKYVR